MTPTDPLRGGSGPDAGETLHATAGAPGAGAPGGEERRPLVTAVVVAYRSAGHLPRLLPALAACVDEVVVVDNASDDGSAEVAALLVPGAVVVRRERNDGFAAGVNAGVARATGDLLLLCNPDVTLTEGAVAALVAAASRHPGHVLGPLVRLPGGRVQPTRSGRPSLWNLLGEQVLVPESAAPGSWPARLWPRWRGHDREQPGPLLSGVCLLVPRALWRRTGDLDDGYFMYFEEIDWQLRAQRYGARSILVPSAVVTHQRSASTGVHDEARARLFAASARRFVRRWLPGWRAPTALALLATGQLARALAWSLPPLHGRPAARARRAQHRAALRELLRPGGPRGEGGRTAGAADPGEAGAGRAAGAGDPGEVVPRVWVVEQFGRGGIARYAADVADLLAPGVEAVVATASAGPAPGLRASHTVWFATGGGGALAKARAGLAALARLPWRVARGDVAWIPLGVRPSFEVVLAVALRLRGARLIATLHNRAPHGRDRASRLVLAAARRADAVVVHSEALAAWARDRGLPVTVLPFPAPREDAGGPAGRHTREGLGAGPGEVLVALVGNLYAYKGVDVLLDAAAQVVAGGDGRLRFVLAGQPPAGTDLGGEVARRGLGACVRVISGYLEPGELVDVLCAADAVVLPYRRIDHSGVGALAAARGLPAIASDLPALRELFGDAAVYVPPGDARRLAAALGELPGRLGALRGAAAARRPTAPAAGPYRALARRVAAAVPRP